MLSALKPRRSIAFHIGAHKTATSHLQRSLMRQQDALIAAGVRVLVPRDLRQPRRNLQRRFHLSFSPDAVPPKRTPRSALRMLLRDVDHLAISEENFIGSPHDDAGALRLPLYPDAPSRLAELAAALAPNPLDVLIGIRHPTRFLNSSYGQLLLGDRIVTLDDYRAGNAVMDVDWLGLIKRIRAAPGVRHVTVWRYEDYLPLFDRICTALLGATAAGLVSPIQKTVHQGLSVAAVQRVLAEYAAGEGGRLAVAARRDLPISATNPAFNGFSQAETAQADVQYADQWAQICALPSVTSLRSL